MNRNRQRGMVLLLLMLTMTVGAAGLLLSGRVPTLQASGQSSIQPQVSLAHAAEAVIAHNLADDVNPGALVCPDMEDNGNPAGESDDDVCEESEEGAWLIGRLPWRELGLPREYLRYWYVIDVDFSEDHLTSASEFNPSVRGELSLEGDDGYAAIILDPGPTREGQIRKSSNYHNVIHYLENMDGSNPDGGNAVADTSASNPEFIDCTGVNHCNDRAYGVRADELFASVQLRVIGELEKLFHAYSGPGEMPRAAPIGSTNCDPNTFIGQVPTDAGDCEAEEYIDLDDLGSEYEWIVDNQWLEYVIYVVDDGCTADGSGCGSLRLNGVGGVRRLLFGAGSTLPGQERMTEDEEINDYLDLWENANGDEKYLRTTVTRENNDVVRWR